MYAYPSRFVRQLLLPGRRRSGVKVPCSISYRVQVSLTHRPPSRTDTDEIDGSFKYQDVPYLVEARWRKEQPNQTDFAGFLAKVHQRFQGTRGLFVSIAGFRSEVVDMFDRRGYSILLMDGSDLALILEEQVGLTETLDLKLERATTYGHIYFRLVDR